MTQTQTEDFLAASEAALHRALSLITAGLDAQTEPPDKAAKGISSILKALDDITAHRTRRTEAEAKTRHMSYDELPPPTPEEAAHFRTIFDKMVEVRAEEMLAAQHAVHASGQHA